MIIISQNIFLKLYILFKKNIHLKGSNAKIVFSNNGYYASGMMVNVSILGYIWICEVLVNFENMTTQGVLGSKIKEVERSDYLPIRIDGNTTGSQYCANLMNDGFSGIDQSKVSENNMDDIDCNLQNKSIKIEQLLYLYKPDFISSIILWSYIDTSVISCSLQIFTNITILLYTNSNTTELCSEKVDKFKKDRFMILVVNCSNNSENAIKSVSIQISNWNGGHIAEIALYSKLVSYENYRGNIEGISTNYFILIYYK